MGACPPISPTAPSSVNPRTSHSGTGEYADLQVYYSSFCDGCKANFYQFTGTSANDGACIAW